MPPPGRAGDHACIARRLLPAGLVLALLMRSAAAAAAPPILPTYAGGTIPVAPGNLTLEFPLFGNFRGEVAALLLSQGTFQDRNPFAYLSGVSSTAWLHFDGVRNLRLSAAFQELWIRAVTPAGLPSGRQDWFIARARFQQPRGAAAVYEMAQLVLQSFDDPRGVHQLVVAPRFRFGQGLNLDAARINSLALFEEVGFRFADASYATRGFEFARGFVGYTWTSRRGIFVTFGVVGQISLNPAGTGFTAFYGPVLSLTYRINPKADEAPPEPPALDAR